MAAYDENDVLLTETLHPPLRNNKTFEQLRIIRIVQPKHELHANEPAYVYCDYDYSKSKSEYDPCPYEFELVFTRSTNTLNENQLLKLFDKPHISTGASSVPNCSVSKKSTTMTAFHVMLFFYIRSVFFNFKYPMILDMMNSEYLFDFDIDNQKIIIQVQ